MVAEKVNEELGKSLIQKTGNREESYRDVLNPYLTNLFYEKLGINIIFGYRTDEKAEQLFLPVELMNSLEKLQINQKPFVDKTVTLFEQDPSLLSNSWWNTIYTFLFILLLIALSHNNTVYLSFLVIIGLFGIFLSLVGFYSLHREVLRNYNVLLFNPFLLGIVYFYLQKNQVWFTRLLYFVLVNFLVYFLFMLNKAHFIQMLPIFMTIAYILFRLHRNLKKA